MAVRRSRKALGRRWEVLQLEVGGRGRCEMRHLRSACSLQFGGLVQGRFATALVPDVRTSELHRTPFPISNRSGSVDVLPTLVVFFNLRARPPPNFRDWPVETLARHHHRSLLKIYNYANTSGVSRIGTCFISLCSGCLVCLSGLVSRAPPRAPLGLAFRPCLPANRPAIHDLDISPGHHRHGHDALLRVSGWQCAV